MQNNKLHWIEIVLLIALLVFFGIQAKNQNGVFGGRSSGGDSAQDEIVVFDGVGTMASIASYDGSDDTIITDAAHGLVVGDVVMFNTSSAAFGDGEAAPGFLESIKYYVVTASISTVFEVSTAKGGTTLDLTVASAGGGEFFTKEFSETGEFHAEDFEFKAISIYAEETPSLSFKVLGSDMIDPPDWYASQSSTNRYDYIAIWDLESNTEIEGDAGIRVDGVDSFNLYEVFSNNLNWLMVISENFASGSVDIRIKGF